MITIIFRMNVSFNLSKTQIKFGCNSCGLLVNIWIYGFPIVDQEAVAWKVGKSSIVRESFRRGRINIYESQIYAFLKWGNDFILYQLNEESISCDNRLINYILFASWQATSKHNWRFVILHFILGQTTHLLQW